MSIAVITGSAGLIGSEAAKHFAGKGMRVVGIDNNMREYFFGQDASTAWMRERLESALPNYEHHDLDIRDRESVFRLFRRYGKDIALIVHTAAQPSHDWAAREPFTDFGVNALGTLTMLEAARQFAPDAVFIFTSTNKVYGDSPNLLPLIEKDTRWEIDPAHAFTAGISEGMSIDASMHSIFGASKVAADVMVQEYGRYFGMKTACFRGGCLTGPSHSGAQLHGFLAYLMKCCVTGTPYNVFGYRGKQVRDNIHSVDLIAAFEQFFSSPRSGEVYNMGGSRFSNCSMLEAIGFCEQITERKLNWTYAEQNRQGDHIWWISDVRRFQSHYPEWKLTYDVPAILAEIYEANRERWKKTQAPASVAVAQTKAAKQNILGVLVDAVDYDSAVEPVIAAGKAGRPFAVSALAVHGVMTGVMDRQHRFRLNHLDLVVPDGQPVRWALNWLHKTGLKDRVYGPNMTLRVLERAAEGGLPVFFYGSTSEVLDGLTANLRRRFPKLVVAGAEPSRFRPVSKDEQLGIVERIRSSGARIVFVGIGCPRQEVWAFEHRDLLSMPVLAVGAAFPFLAGTLAQAPQWMQDRGLEWLYRLTREPRRLWRRYVLLNPAYLTLLVAQVFGYRFSTQGLEPQEQLLG